MAVVATVLAALVLGSANITINLGPLGTYIADAEVLVNVLVFLVLMLWVAGHPGAAPFIGIALGLWCSMLHFFIL